MPRVSQAQLIKQLTESNVALQSRTVDLMKQMMELTKRIDGMVELFEEAATHIKSGTDEPLLRKLDGLLEQNKNIARGLILLERYIREKGSVEENFPPRPLPRSEF